MCLYRLLSKKQKTEILDKITRKGITVYKLVKVVKRKYISLHQEKFIYEEGKNEAEFNDSIRTTNGSRYMPGFHSFQTKSAAEKHLKYFGRYRRGRVNHTKLKVVACKIYKSWITEIGMNAVDEKEDSCNMLYAKTFITDKIVMPKYEE